MNGGPKIRKNANRQVSYVWPACRTPKHLVWNMNMAAHLQIFIFTFFIDYGHIYVSNGRSWGSTSRPHIGDMVMNLFFYFEVTVHDWGTPPPKDPFWKKYISKISIIGGRYKSCWPKRVQTWCYLVKSILELV